MLAIVPAAWSQEPQQAPQAEQPQVRRIMFRHCASVNGKDLYNAYCVYCHGEDAKGHGPQAAVLRVQPADLTTIAARNGGKFAGSAVEDKILGWKLVPRSMKETSDMVNAMNTGKNADNVPVMPLFGPIFASLYSQEIRDRQVRIANLVGYVKSVQVKSAPVEEATKR
jgi:hypothetical protein